MADVESVRALMLLIASSALVYKQEATRFLYSLHTCFVPTSHNLTETPLASLLFQSRVTSARSQDSSQL